jgi:GNAT superfamily N-acetyltransferase
VTTIIPAQPADLTALSQLIADAFRDLPPSLWLLPDPADRARIFPGYFRLYLDHALAGGVIATTPGRDAVALWIPAGTGPPPPPPGYAARLAALTTPWTGRFTAFDTVLDQAHPAGTPHHHLAILAVRPGRQGQGLGSALLAGQHRLLDHAGLPAYLEASSSRSRGLYLRHGYADHGPPITLPGGPPLYPMLRPPRCSARPAARALRERRLTAG